MARVCFFIDGLNVYHALKDNRNFHKYKWLDYTALARCYLRGQDTLVETVLFTALATWDQSKVVRHKIYLRALRTRGVSVTLGKFKRKSKNCPKCHQSFHTPEEKLTDVNIAIQMFAGAYLDKYDRAILISGDTDIIPAVKMIHSLFPRKEVCVVVPIGRRSNELKQECDFSFQMKEHQLAKCQLDEVILDGPDELRKPDAWN